MTTPTVHRKPAGTPVGGQFAAGTKAAPDTAVTLAPRERSEQEKRDDVYMDRIAVVLGEDQEWDGVADYTEAIANILGASGRPHPGGLEWDEYPQAWQDYLATRGDVPSHPATEQLDQMARQLGEAADWGADELDWICDSVRAAGRPNPGGDLYGSAYLRAVRDAALAGGRREPDNLDRLEDALSADGRHPAADIVAVIVDRGEVAPADFPADDAFVADLKRDTDQVVGELVDYINEGADLPGSQLGGDVREIVADLADSCSEDIAAPSMSNLLLAAIDTGRVSDAGARKLSEGDVIEMFHEHVEPLAERYEQRLAAAQAARSGAHA